MDILKAIATSKLVITVSLFAGLTTTFGGEPMWMRVVAWTVFGGAFVGRAVQQYRETPSPE